MKTNSEKEKKNTGDVDRPEERTLQLAQRWKGPQQTIISVYRRSRGLLFIVRLNNIRKKPISYFVRMLSSTVVLNAII